jgi:hypothetical protein
MLILTCTIWFQNEKKNLEQKKVAPLCEHIIFIFLSKKAKNRYYLKNKKMLFLDTDLL